MASSTDIEIGGGFGKAIIFSSIVLSLLRSIEGSVMKAEIDAAIKEASIRNLFRKRLRPIIE